MTLLLRMDDNMNRQLTCEFMLNEMPKSLADELVTHGFINAVSRPHFITLSVDNTASSYLKFQPFSAELRSFAFVHLSYLHQ